MNGSTNCEARMPEIATSQSRAVGEVEPVRVYESAEAALLMLERVPAAGRHPFRKLIY